MDTAYRSLTHFHRSRGLGPATRVGQQPGSVNRLDESERRVVERVVGLWDAKIRLARAEDKIKELQFRIDGLDAEIKDLDYRAGTDPVFGTYSGYMSFQEWKKDKDQLAQKREERNSLQNDLDQARRDLDKAFIDKSKAEKEFKEPPGAKHR